MKLEVEKTGSLGFVLGFLDDREGFVTQISLGWNVERRDASFLDRRRFLLRNSQFRTIIG